MIDGLLAATALHHDLRAITQNDSAEQYDSLHKRSGDLVGKGRARTADETAFMNLLDLLIQDYDRRHALPPLDDTRAERLQYVLEVVQKTPARPVAGTALRSRTSFS